jgi:hypothetical protein
MANGIGRLFSVGLEFHRRGWIPGLLVGALSLHYFKRIIA